jgi:hypothetical protein
MNERLRELSIYAGYAPHWSTKADRNENFDKDKFADLIIEEVLTVVAAVEPGVTGLPADAVIRQVRSNIIDYFDRYNF